ncbi:MAG TPA: TetR/AcrR family transcriptional regulator [Acidimicrobiales bacterium]|nr:TetR/AcrR family transcriptional regulator [Acidimicrobiales bacterium]
MARTAVVTTPTQERALDSALDLVARWGVAKTTLGDVARATGVSRATLYRTFPGGKDELFALLAQREVARFLDVVGRALDSSPDTTAALVDGLHAAAVHLEGHAAIRYVLAHEPELAVPVLGFGEMDRLLRLVRRAVAPHLVDRLGPEAAGWTAEWLARVFLSALVNPTPTFALADRAVCDRLVRRYVAPAVVPAPEPVPLAHRS